MQNVILKRIIEEEERQQRCQFRAHGNVRLFFFGPREPAPFILFGLL
jgi:hypothetical protein